MPARERDHEMFTVTVDGRTLREYEDVESARAKAIQWRNGGHETTITGPRGPVTLVPARLFITTDVSIPEIRRTVSRLLRERGIDPSRWISEVREVEYTETSWRRMRRKVIALAATYVAVDGDLVSIPTRPIIEQVNFAHLYYEWV